MALRHEINLQTRAVRAQQELNAETLRQLSQAVESARQPLVMAALADSQAEEERLRPLLKALVDLHDALALAGRQVPRVHEAIMPALDQLLAALQPVAEPAAPPESAPSPPRRPSLFARWFGQAPAEPPPAQEATPDRGEPGPGALPALQQAQQVAERVRELLDSVVTGYTMSVQRVERALQQQGLEPIPAVGQAFDPEQMEVVDVVRDSDQPANQVVEEVRRGYWWRGRVFRYAQVRVAKP